MAKRLSATDLLMECQSKFLDARNICYLVGSNKFAAAIDMATDKQYNEIIDLIARSDTTALRSLITSILKNDLSLKNVTELRCIASRLGITGSNRIHKTGLLSLIKKEAENEEN